MSATPRTTRLREELEKDWASRSSYEESQANYEEMASLAARLERELLITRSWIRKEFGTENLNKSFAYISYVDLQEPK